MPEALPIQTRNPQPLTFEQEPRGTTVDEDTPPIAQPTIPERLHTAGEQFLMFEDRRRCMPVHERQGADMWAWLNASDRMGEETLSILGQAPGAARVDPAEVQQRTNVMGEAMANLDLTKADLRARGVTYSGDFGHLRSRSMATMSNELGNTWRAVWHPQEQRKLLSIAASHDIIQNSTISDEKLAVYDQFRWARAAQTFGLKAEHKTPARFVRDLHEIELAVTEDGTMDEMAGLLLSDRRPGVPERSRQVWDEYLSYQGIDPNNLDDEAYKLQLRNFVKFGREDGQRYETVAKAAALGYDVNPDKLGPNSELRILDLAPDEVVQQLAFRTTYQTGANQPYLAQHYTIEDLKNTLHTEPGNMVARLTADSDMTPQERDALTKEIRGWGDKDHTFWALMDRLNTAPSWTTPLTSLFGSVPPSPAQIRSEQQRLQMLTKWRALVDSQQQQHLDYQQKLQPQDYQWTAEMTQEVRDQDQANFQKQLYQQQAIKSAMDEASLHKFLMLPLTVMGKAAHAVTQGVDRVLTRAYTEEAVYNMTRAVEQGWGLPAGEANLPVSPTEFIGRWMLGSQADANATIAEYARRRESGGGGAWDQLALTGGVLWNGLVDMPGFFVEAPLEGALFGKMAHGYGRARAGVAAKLEKAGVNQGLIAGVEFAMNPISVMQPLKRVLGYTPEFAFKVGLTQRAFARKISKLPTAVREKAWEYMRNMLDSEQFQSRMTGDKVTALRDHLSFLEVAAKKSKVTWKDSFEFGGALKDVPADLVRSWLLPFSKAGLSFNPIGDIVQAKQEYSTLLQAEQGLSAAGRSPLKSLVDFMNTRSENRAAKFEQFGKTLRLDKIMGGTFKNLVDWANRRVALEDLAPQLTEHGQAAFRSMNDQVQASEKVRHIYSQAATRRGYEIEELDRRMTLATQNAKAFPHRQAEFQAEVAQLHAEWTKQKSLQQEYSMEVSRLYQQQKNTASHSTEAGLEVGFKSQLSPEARELLIRETARHLQAEHKSIMELYPEWDDAALDVLREHQRINNVARTSLLNADGHAKRTLVVLNQAGPATALAYLRGKLPESGIAKSARATPQSVLDAVAKERGVIQDRLQKLDLTEQEVLAHKLSKFDTEYFEVRPLNERFQTTLQRIREVSANYRRLIGAEADAPAGLYQVVASQFDLSSTGRILSGISGRVGDTYDVPAQALRKLRGMASQMNEHERAVLNGVLTGKLDPIDTVVGKRITNMAFEYTNLRNQLFDILEKQGKITTEQKQAWLTRNYEEHVFLKEYAGKHLGGYVGTEGAPPGKNVEEAVPPRFAHLRPQKSIEHSKLYYFDPRKGKIEVKHFGVKEYGGVKESVEAAERFREQLKKDHFSDQEIGQLVPATTPEQLQLLGIVDSAGDVRWDTMQRLFSEAMATELFSHFANMHRLVRRGGLADLPASKRKAWSQPLEGRLWGDLEGAHVHRSVFNMLNHATRYNTVLSSVARQLTEQSSELWTKLGGIQGLLATANEPMTNRTAQWIDSQIRRSFIWSSARTFMTNHFGNVWSSVMAGVNPFSPTYIKGLLESQQLHKLHRQGRLNPADPVHAEFLRAIRAGHVSPSIGAGMEALTDPTQFELQRKMETLTNKQTEWTKLLGTLEPGSAAAKKVAANIDQAQYAIDQVKSDLTPYTLGGQSGLGFFFRNVAFPNTGPLNRAIRSAYANVDSHHRWAARQSLKAKGMGEADATARIDALFQNYGALPQWLKDLRNQGMLGAFTPGFPYEAARIMKNALALDPARVLGVTLSPLLWNVGVLGANGLTVNDYLDGTRNENTLDVMRTLLTTALVPTGGGEMASLDVFQMTPINVFMQPTGLGRLPTEAIANQGPVATAAALPLIYASNFVFNTPQFSALTKVATGIDLYTGAALVDSRDDPAWLTRTGLADLQSWIVPRTLMATKEVIEEANDPIPNRYTGEIRPIAQSILGKLVGLKTKTVNPRAMFLNVLFDAADEKQVEKLYSYKQQEERTELMRAKALYDGIDSTVEAKKEALERGSRQIQDMYAEEQLSPQQATERFVDWAAQNLYNVTDRIALDVLPKTLFKLETAGFRQGDPDLLAYAWAQLLNPEYLSRRQDVDDLMDTWQQCYTLAGRAPSPEVRDKFQTGAQNVAQQLLKTMLNSQPLTYQMLLKTKLSNWDKLARAEFARQVGMMH
jgi:hypothetical protein